MELRIVTDSVSDLLQELVDRYRIVVVPALIIFDNGTYLDGVEITHQEIYRRVLQEDAVPKSSQPSPGQFLEAYKEVAVQGASIISIHVTAKTSGVWQSASLARSMLPESISRLSIRLPSPWAPVSSSWRRPRPSRPAEARARF